jgi:hypothetical protein
MHSEMQFKQQKIMILFKITSQNSDQKAQKIKCLANGQRPLYQIIPVPG